MKKLVTSLLATTLAVASGTVVARADGVGYSYYVNPNTDDPTQSSACASVGANEQGLYIEEMVMVWHGAGGPLPAAVAGDVGETGQLAPLSQFYGASQMGTPWGGPGMFCQWQQEQAWSGAGQAPVSGSGQR